MSTLLLVQTKGYAEGAGDSLAGGAKKNLAKVTGNDAKQAEGTSPPLILDDCPFVTLGICIFAFHCLFVCHVAYACLPAADKGCCAGEARQTKGDAKKEANK